MKYGAILLVCPLFFAPLIGKPRVEVWNSEEIYVPFSRKVGFLGNVACHSRANRKAVYYKHYQGGVHLAYSHSALFYLAYRHVFHRIGGQWLVERAPILDWILQFGRIPGMSLAYRNRVQYGSFDQRLQKKDYFLYRGRLEWTLPAFYSNQTLFPYFSDEMFWKKGMGIDQNRIEGGVKILYQESVSCNLSYLRCFFMRSDREKKWGCISVIRVNFSLRF